jgi:peptide deformylase
MILDIKQHPDPILSTPAAEAVPGPELSMLLHSMVETLRATPNAVGLAAPQVGVALRAFVMGTEEQGYLAVVNPVIVRRSGIKIPSTESCLSAPGVTVTVKRANSITVRAIDAEGNPCEFTCKGRAACIVAHEIDHLDGKTIAD